MAKKKKERKSRRRRSKTPLTLAQEAFGAEVGKLILEDVPSIVGATFEEGMVCLYGPPKIGKSDFAQHIDGVYFLPTEPGYKWLNVRKTVISDWASFIAFIKLMKKKPKFVSTVKMWCIDTGGNLSKFAMQYACGREDIAHPTDHEWGKGWEAFGDEFNYWLLELSALGPGVIIIAHEKDRNVVIAGTEVTKFSPSMPKTTYEIINALADVTLHMSYDKGMIKAKTTRKKGKRKKPDLYACRCFYTKGDDNRDAGDRSNLLPPKIPFETTQEALDKILGYFEAGQKGDKKKRKLRKERE
jgi:hypothetical protein